MKTAIHLILSLFLFFLIPVIEAQHVIPRATQVPKLSDYRSPDSLPENPGLEITNFIQRRPRDGDPASYATKAYLSYDEQNLYAVFVAKANPEHLIARHSRRENNGGEDWVMLEVDTFHDKQRAYLFYVTPLGVQADSQLIEGKEEDFDFDTQWQSEGELTPTGYMVKITIPFKSLRFPSGDKQTWGLAVTRYIPELSEFVSWPHISRKKAFIIDQFAHVTILERISPQKNWQLIPYIYSGATKLLKNTSIKGKNSVHFENDKKTQAGFDAKYVWNNAFTFDLTVKPDFSEVESDEPQVLVDQRFETLFPEKRPFFIENSGFFQTPIPLFFSRRIVEPEGGLRVTGRQANYALGGLIMNDIGDGKNQKSNISMMRGQIDVGDSSNIGLLTTSKQQGHDANRVTSIDFRTTPIPNWALIGQYAYSQNKGTQATNDHLGYLNATYNSLNIKYNGKLTHVGELFDASIGFIPQYGIRKSDQAASYIWFSKNSAWLNSQELKTNFINTQDQDKAFIDKKTELTYTIQAKRTNTIVLKAFQKTEKLNQQHIDTQGWLVSWESNTLPQLLTTLAFGKKQTPNYRYVDPRVLKGDTDSAQIKLRWLLGKHWSIEETYFYNTLSHQGKSIYQDRIARTALNYQLNNRWGTSIILDYHDLNSNPALSSLKKGKTLNTNAQLHYVLSPGTSFYLTYIDRQESLQLSRDIDGLHQVYPTDKLNLHTGKSISLKMNYLF